MAQMVRYFSFEFRHFSAHHFWNVSNLISVTFSLFFFALSLFQVDIIIKLCVFIFNYFQCDSNCRSLFTEIYIFFFYWIKPANLMNFLFCYIKSNFIYYICSDFPKSNQVHFSVDSEFSFCDVVLFARFFLHSRWKIVIKLYNISVDILNWHLRCQKAMHTIPKIWLKIHKSPQPVIVSMPGNRCSSDL